jgi:acyl-CoA hydrolase
VAEAGPFRLADVIRQGDRVLLAQGCAEPQTLSEQLVAAHRDVGRFESFVGPLFSTALDRGVDEGMRLASYGAMGRTSRFARAGLLEVWPLHYSALTEGFASGALVADVVLLQLARGPNGRLGATLANDYAIAAARRARCVVAEINAKAPWCEGGELEPGFRVDVAIESDRPLVLPPRSAPSEVEAAIAANVAALIPDRATLQLGIGAIPDAVLAALASHRDLGVHSGLITDGVVDLIEAGVITNAAKSRDLGVTVTNTAFGSEKLHRLLDRNKAVRLAPASYTHAAAVLACHRQLVAVNSALEVDLAGNINAELVDGVAVGGTGGIVDFVRGARAAPGGQAVIALRATDRTGEISRIVPKVAAVTVPKSDADVVVTEFGVARLRNLGAAGRAKALVAVAAPRRREGLMRSLREAGL